MTSGGRSFTTEQVVLLRESAIVTNTEARVLLGLAPPPENFSDSELRSALERLYLEELNGRLCPLPDYESQGGFCCERCAGLWRTVRRLLYKGGTG